MRKIALMVGALIVLTAGIASAASISLTWAKCRPDPGALANRNPTCASNTGQGVLVTTFEPPSGVAVGLDGIETYIDYQTEDGVAANCWWNFLGAQRSSALSVAANDPGVNGAPTFGCPSYFLSKGGGTGGGGMALLGNGNGRISGVCGILAGSGTDPGTAEQTGTIATIKNDNTTTCAGCLKKACLTLNRIVFLNKNGQTFEVNTPKLAGSNTASQQGGFVGCSAATPTRKATWGSVKALYR